MAEDEKQGEAEAPVQEQPEAGPAPVEAPPAEPQEEPAPEAPAETPAEAPKEAPAEAPAEASVEAPVESPVEAAKDEAPVEAAKDEAPVEAAKDEVPVEAVKDEAPVEAAKDEAPVEAVKDEVPVEAVKDEVPVEAAKDEAPVEVAKDDAPVEAAKDDAPLEAQAEAPSEEPEADAEAEGKPKRRASKRSKKAKAEAEPEVAEGDVLIETIDEKTDRKVSYTVKPLFGKYPFTGVVVQNPGLQRYVNISPVSVPHTGARHANRPFAKQHVNIVERLINGMMRNEWGTGEKAKMYRVVEEAFDIIHDRTKQNPIQVFVDALSNSAPKEEVTRLRYGGINVPKAVDVSASRRLDIALRNICHGAIQSSHNNKKRLQQCLADEIILASKREINSFAVAKKEELERIAASAR